MSTIPPAVPHQDQSPDAPFNVNIEEIQAQVKAQIDLNLDVINKLTELIRHFDTKIPLTTERIEAYNGIRIAKFWMCESCRLYRLFSEGIAAGNLSISAD